jgi:acetylornithine/N-succinyldiaminopimelate aminotransferase
MKLFDVYPKYPISIEKADGVYVWDDQGARYLDFYGGHAVISVGHGHKHYVERIKEQLNRIGFYSNAVEIPEQLKLADLLGVLSGYPDFQFFMCNSGAEANENAFKLASFHTGRKKIIVFEKGFHGRTSLAVSATDNPQLVAEVNQTDAIIRLPFNNLEALKNNLNEEVAAVCIEGIQGISGIYEPNADFLRELSSLCKTNGTMLILDEIQSGFGRSGKFFAHQYAEITPDIITIAKGMANGFPVGGVMIAPEITAWSGMLGTTFGGNQLACAASLAVLEVIQKEDLISNAETRGKELKEAMEAYTLVKEVRGKGLMIGVEFEQPVKSLRQQLLFDHRIFTGSASNPNTLRLLPPLSISQEHVQQFLAAFEKVISHETVSVS